MTPENPRASGPRRAAGLPLLLLALLACFGCGSTPPTRWFVLVPTVPPPANLARPDLSVEFEPVVLPASLQRPQLVRRIGTHELRLAEYERWAEPLEDNLGAVLAEDVGRLLGTDQVSSAGGLRLPQAERRVAVELLRLGAEPQGELVLLARWAVRDRNGALAAHGRTRHAEPLPAGDAASFVGAANRCVGVLAQELAQALAASTPGG